MIRKNGKFFLIILLITLNALVLSNTGVFLASGIYGQTTTNQSKTIVVKDNRELNSSIYPNYQDSYNREGNINFENCCRTINDNNYMSLNDINDWVDLSGTRSYGENIPYEETMGLWDGDASNMAQFLREFSTPIENLTLNIKISLEDEFHIYFYDSSTVFFHLKFDSNNIYYYTTLSSSSDIGDYVDNQYYNMRIIVDNTNYKIDIYLESQQIYYGNMRDSYHATSCSMINLQSGITPKNYYTKIGLIREYQSLMVPLSDFTKTENDGISYYYSNVGNYSNVITLEDKSTVNSIDMIHYFSSAQTIGTIELYAGTNGTQFRIMVGGASLLVYFTTTNIVYYNGSTQVILMSYNPNQLYHIRIEFDCNTDKGSVWINGIQKVNNLSFYLTATSFSYIQFKSYNPVYSKSYIKNIGYSWNDYTPRQMLFEDTSSSTGIVESGINYQGYNDLYYFEDNDVSNFKRITYYPNSISFFELTFLLYYSNQFKLNIIHDSTYIFTFKWYHNEFLYYNGSEYIPIVSNLDYPNFHIFSIKFARANVSFYVDNEFKLRTEANRYSFSTINKFAFNT
ncbi:MAG: hypothetical protein ACP6IY_19300, partial [Promethearchaeia archaeon]